MLNQKIKYDEGIEGKIKFNLSNRVIREYITIKSWVNFEISVRLVGIFQKKINCGKSVGNITKWHG